MSAPRWTELLVPLVLGLRLVTGDLTRPQNLTLHTRNTFYVLHWDWADESAGNQTVRFTADYLPAFQTNRPAHKQNWSRVCRDALERRCDFTHAELHYLGRYFLRVRAATALRSSDWSQISFCPDEEAALGPPSSVRLWPGNGTLEIVLTDPMTSTNETMRTVLDQMGFLIQYWRDEDGVQAAQVLQTENNVVVLQNLDRWTRYCVRVQSHRDFDNKISVFSDTHCIKILGKVPPWEVFLYFLLSLIFCFLLVVLLAFCYFRVLRTVNQVFFPGSSLPAYIQELWWSEAEAPPLLLLVSGSPESVCEVCVSTSAEVGVPSASTEDQDSSSGSSDSGVYSTEEDSPHRRWTPADPPVQEQSAGLLS